LQGIARSRIQFTQIHHLDEFFRRLGAVKQGPQADEQEDQEMACRHPEKH
jgi:hypothetical protein